MFSSGRVADRVILVVLIAKCFAASADALPDDQLFPLQWGLQNTGQDVQGAEGLPGADVNAPGAWGIHAGTSSTVVAIVGTGVNPHAEFADRLIQGYATVGDPLDTSDPCSEGTHVAGIIAATRDNGVGIAGLHDRVQLLPVRVFSDCTQGNATSAAAGIEWAVDQGADIVVCAFAFVNGHPRLADAVAYAVARDVLVIAPAGDDRNDEVSYPAAYNGCLAVTATTQDDTLASFSNYGSEVDLSAPGENIISTWSVLPFEYRSSTVSAAAYVTGVAALLMSYAPELSSAEVGQLLRDSAHDLGDPGWDVRFGAGRLNAWNALYSTPAPAIRFEHTEALPTMLLPGAATSFTVKVADSAETVVADSVRLYYRIGSGSFVEASATALPDGLYAFELPALPCDARVEYYLSATGNERTSVRDPLDAPATVYQAHAMRTELTFRDDFETDLGWEAFAFGGEGTTGQWERVEPTGTLGVNGIPVQPEYDHSPGTSQICYITGQHNDGGVGGNDVDAGPVELVSPIIPFDAPDAEIRYARWFYSSGGIADALTVELSRDGGDSWFLVESVSSTAGWEEHSTRLSEFPESTGSQLRLRFSTQDQPCEFRDSICASLTEAAVDEFQIRAILCASSLGDFDGDGHVDLLDAGHMIACLSGPPSPSASALGPCSLFDFDDDSGVDLRDWQAFQNLFAYRNN